MTTSEAVTQRMPAPELLAPAGNVLCAKAAVENGADAIYFGLEAGFNARARAENITLDQLPELMAMLHGRGVKGYVTLNTLAFTDELPRLQKYVRQLAIDGVDAVLVQDVGVARLVKKICPDLEIHASTQMTLTHCDAINAVAELGISRVVLARELSIKEITKIAAGTTMPLEVFVHGALCVAYSGQCLTSESLGGRSANRGQCAQACRLPYEMVCDGKERDLGPVRYLLSPQDLAAYHLVPQLIEAGVVSLKIEGRLKTPEYVANIVQNYRQAIDCAMEGMPKQWTDEDRRQMEMSFSRGFTPGWLEGNDHKRLSPGLSSAKRGVKVGTVVRRKGSRLLVDLAMPLAKGDGIVLEGDRVEGTEVGGRVYEIFQNGQAVEVPVQGQVELSFARGLLEDADLFAGQEIWQTDDPRLSRRLRQTFSSETPQRLIDVDVRISIGVGLPVRLVANCGGQEIIVPCDHVPEVARQHPVSQEVLQQQLGRLGGTIYRLKSLEANIVGQAMMPLSVLGSLRKSMVALLAELPKSKRRVVGDADVLGGMLASVATSVSSGSDQSSSKSEGVGPTDTPAGSLPKLSVLCRSMQQLRFALEAGAKNLVADFHDIREYREAVQVAHDLGATIDLASLRIHKPGEDGLFKAMSKHNADGWLVRNIAAADYAAKLQIPVTADFSLNVTNPLSAQWWINRGARRVTASYDLNRDQLLELVDATPAAWLEVVIHQHMPMFHMEHCVFCNVLSPGTNKTNCGRPCDRHDVQLRDRVGALHVLHADIGCRNTLYNGAAQSGAEAVKPLIDKGVRHFRIELLKDAPKAEVEQLIGLYRSLICGRIDGARVWQQLKAQNRVGVTRGTLEQPRNPLAIL